jgi:hypothetical protein
MKIKDIKEYIFIHFGKVMTDNGFFYKKTDNEFFCSKGDYTYIFNMPLTSWSRSYELSVRLFIKQKRIENVYESILGKSHGLTLNQEMIERIYYSPDGRKIVKGDSLGIWLVKDNDIINAVDILNIYYNKIANPILKGLVHLKALTTI